MQHQYNTSAIPISRYGISSCDLEEIKYLSATLCDKYVVKTVNTM